MAGRTPSGTRGVLKDAVSIYFTDPAVAGAFVARWCIGYKVETAEGAFRMREDESEPRVGARLHRTPCLPDGARSPNSNLDNRTGYESDDMNDPHVEALYYTVTRADDVDYDKAPPCDIDKPGFKVHLANSRAEVTMKSHHATAETARAHRQESGCAASRSLPRRQTSYAPRSTIGRRWS
jgi:hypothetical protein